MNAGGKKAVLWGTALDNLAVVADGDARRASGSRSRASTTTSARSTTRAQATFELRVARRATARRVMRTRDARRFPARRSARRASARTSPTSSSRACPACRRKAATAHHQRALHPAPDAAGDPHRVPRVLRPGARFDAGDRRDQGLPRRAAQDGSARVILAGLEHLDERYVKAVGYATKAKRHGRPKMVLLGDIVGDDDDAVAKAASRGRAHRQRARRRRLRRGVGRSAQEVLARPRAHRGDRQAHQRVQDQRGRGHPARRASATTPTASSASTSSCRSRNKLKLARRARGAASRARCSSTLWAPDSDARPAAGDRRREGRRGARARRGRRARAGRTCSTASTTTFPRAAGPLDRRVVEDASCRRRSRRSSPACAFAPVLTRDRRRSHARGAAQPRVRRAAHARRRRQRAHQHPGQLRRLRRCCRRPTRRSRASWRSRARSAA